MAKIHTVEWTPAIIAHPTTQLAMRANWWGILGEGFKKRFGCLGTSEILSGIPGSPVNHNGVPYSLTEEFVGVYRMHPLIPDDYTFRSVENDSVVAELPFPELGALKVRRRLEEISMPNALYTFGISNPGAITLHNYPYHLQHLHRPDGEVIDLAATDVLRIRERGVPRYNEFRRLFHKPTVGSFEDLTGGDATRAKELKEIYGDDLDALDLMVGLYSEPLPTGFGFSDTAFRVFILMASRRLASDRFFTDDYRPEVYTPAGMAWLDNTTMVDILRRHYPSLTPSLEGVANAFIPWKRVT